MTRPTNTDRTRQAIRRSAERWAAALRDAERGRPSYLHTLFELCEEAVPSASRSTR